jgi:hypothetical protein
MYPIKCSADIGEIWYVRLPVSVDFFWFIATLIHNKVFIHEAINEMYHVSSKPFRFFENQYRRLLPICILLFGVLWWIIMGSRLDYSIYWHFFTITVNYYSLQSILTIEASLNSTFLSRTDSKWPSLSPINLQHVPCTENTLGTLYLSNSSIVIEECLCFHCIEMTILLLLPVYLLPRECVQQPIAW